MPQTDISAIKTRLTLHIRLADVVWQILDARPRSGDDAFQEFQHRLSSGNMPPAVYRRRSIWRFGAADLEIAVVELRVVPVEGVLRLRILVI